MITLMWIALGALGAFILVAAIFGVRAVWREAANDPGLTVSAAQAEGFADLGPMPDEIAHEEFLAAPLPTLPPATAEHADRYVVPDPVRYGHNLRYRYSDELNGDFPDPPAELADPPPPPVSPLTKAVQAVAELKDMPADDYLATLDGATTYADLPPLAGLLSDDTITRGFKPIRVDGDMDAPLSAPREWHIELEEA